MKKAFIVTSAIEVDYTKPLTYSIKRSFFSEEERFRQTISTIACLDMAGDHDTTIYLVDMSDNWEKYKSLLFYQYNLKFVSVKNEFPEIFEEVRSHPNKSRGECLLLSTFMRAYAEELKQYDFMFKLSGRYLLDGSFDIGICNEENRNKIFYKKPMIFDWSDDWGYEMVDRRTEQGDQKLRQYCSVFFGWSKPYREKFSDMFTTMSSILAQPNLMKYDHETLGYFFTRGYADDIIETDWLVYGWWGGDGRFVRY
jgi:hypothetical protein